MVRNRPNAVFVMGILNMVFGGLGFCITGLCGIGSVLILRYVDVPGPTGDSLRAYRAALDTEVPEYFAISIISGALGAFFLIVLFVSGIGLIRMRGWGRILSIVFAFIFILTQSASIFWTFTTFLPAADRAQAAMRATLPPQAQTNFNDPSGLVLSIFIYVIEFIYCIALLVVMFLPAVRAAFAGGDPTPHSAENPAETTWGDNE